MLLVDGFGWCFFFKLCLVRVNLRLLESGLPWERMAKHAVLLSGCSLLLSRQPPVLWD